MKIFEAAKNRLAEWAILEQIFLVRSDYEHENLRLIIFHYFQDARKRQKYEDSCSHVSALSTSEKKKKQSKQCTKQSILLSPVVTQYGLCHRSMIN